jgi:riboflavin synthase
VFTGIVEEVGRVRDVVAHDGVVRLTVDSQRVRPRLSLGGSVAVDGCCQTVSALDERSFTVEIMPVTRERTTLGALAPGTQRTRVRPARPHRRTSAAPSCSGRGRSREVETVRSEHGDHRVRVRVPRDLARYLAARGSVAVDGVSLTVADADDDGFTVALIPTTLRETVLGSYEPGRRVNLEVDVVARYLERLTRAGRNE